MRKSIAALLVLACIATASSIVSCTQQKKEGPLVAIGGSISNDSLIKRGDYLVSIMGCDDCHSPKKFGPRGPEPDMDRRFSGHPATSQLVDFDKSQLKSWVLFNQGMTAFVGPWGISYAANLTSDNTGIGTWTEQQFIKALREGKLKGLDNTRTMLPPMPWPNFSKASDDDLRAIFSFLKSTKPIENIVPAPVAPGALASIK
jgi:hypothetical protein